MAKKIAKNSTDGVAVKKAPARRRAAPKAAAPAKPVDLDVQQPRELLSLTLDYPQEGMTIASREYTLRLTAPESVTAVEVAVDDGPWMPCREAVGHWWYDWSGYENGRHVVRARPAGSSQVLTRSVTVAY